MGVVYLAHDARLKRDVAIKVLNARTFADEKARRRFRNEALTLSRLNHPNVECVYEFRSEEDVDFLVLELVAGTALNDLIRHGPLPEQEAVGLGIQLARGLAAAHAQRVLHRDLKPGNLKVTPDNVLKILDFGLAQLMTAPEDNTVTQSEALHGPGAGTLGYVSPEQLEGREPDTRSDIYSAGVVLYELATGSRPFAQHGQLLQDAILHSLPTAPRLKNKEVSAEFEATILKCLEKEPKARYQSARDLLADLERLWAGREPSGGALAVKHQPPRPVPWRRAVIAGGLVLVLAAAGVLVWRKWAHKEVQQKIMAVLPMDAVGQDPATSALGLGLTETVAAKLVQASDTSAVQIVSPQDLRDQKIKTADDARREFGTDLVLESSIQRSGTMLRINCYLVDSKTHRPIAAETIESEGTDPFGLQDKVVNAALDMLAVKLKPEERQRLKAVQNTNPAAYDAYIRGRGYLQEFQKPESIDNAIAEFQKAITIDPRYALAYAGLGNAYWINYDRLFKGSDAAAQALQHCREALSLNPELVDGHICLANVLEGTSKYDEAIVEFKKAIAANPQSDDALRGLAKAYEKSGNLSDAEATYKQAVALRPNSWSNYHSLGLFYYRQSRYSDAVPIFQKEIEIAPDNFQPYTTLGGSYIVLGNYQKAIEALQRSIDLLPNAVAYNNLGYTYYLMHRFPEAVTALRQAVNLNPNNWEFWGNLADAQYWSGDGRAEATSNYRRAIEMISPRSQLDPKDARTMVYLGGYLAMQGKKQQATEHALKALRQTPADSEVLFRAAVIYNQVGQPDQAVGYVGKQLS